MSAALFDALKTIKLRGHKARERALHLERMAKLGRDEWDALIEHRAEACAYEECAALIKEALA